MSIWTVVLILLSPFTAFIPVLGMGYKFYKQRAVIPLNPLNIGLLLLFMWSLITGWLNKDILSMIGAFGILIYFLFAIYFQQFYKTPKGVEVLIEKVWKIGLLTALIGIVEKILSYMMDMTWFSRLFWTINYVPTQDAYRIISTFGNPNVAGDMFAALFLLSLYLILSNKGWGRAPYIVGAVLFIVAMSFTGSKGAALGLELAILAYALFTRNQTNRIFLMGTFIAVLALVFLIPELNHAMNSRTDLWKKCYRLFEARPIIGWGLFGIFKKTGEVHGHNVLITLFTTLGTVGVLIFGSIQMYLVYCMRLLKHKNTEILAVLVSVQVLILGHGLIDFTLMLPQVGVLYFAAVALTSALASRYMAFPVWNWAEGTIVISPKRKRLRSHSGFRT